MTIKGMGHPRYGTKLTCEYCGQEFVFRPRLSARRPKHDRRSGRFCSTVCCRANATLGIRDRLREHGKTLLKFQGRFKPRPEQQTELSSVPPVPGAKRDSLEDLL